MYQLTNDELQHINGGMVPPHSDLSQLSVSTTTYSRFAGESFSTNTYAGFVTLDPNSGDDSIFRSF